MELAPNARLTRKTRAKPRSAVADGGSLHKLESPFLEIEWCWGYIGYVNMLRYHVESAAEVQGTRPWLSLHNARNADILLDEAKLTDLLALALLRTQHSTSQRGSGELSAYAG